MKYQQEDSDLEGICRHLRNKNLATFYDNSRFCDRILNRLSVSISELQMKMMPANRSKVQVVVSEQIIENSLVLRNLRENDRVILDFGGFESILPLQLAAVGYKVTVLDQRKYPFQHPNLKVLCLDLFGDELRIEDGFDTVISISTIEHLGLGTYGDLVVEENADKRAVEILWGLLKEGGRLMASVPAGKPAVQRGYRVYDEKRLYEVFPDITSMRWFMKKGRESVWLEVQSDVVKNVIYSEPYGQMPVEAVVFVICDKR
jgi:SAM-dependent methyltransferase